MPTSRLALPPNPSLTKNLWTLAFSLGGWVEKQKPVNVHRVVAVVHLDGLLTKHRVTVRLLQRWPLSERPRLHRTRCHLSDDPSFSLDRTR